MIWIFVAIISFITASVTLRFPHLLTFRFSVQSDSELSQWAGLIFERAKIHLYDFNKAESDISNWKFNSHIITSQNQCYPFRDIYEQKVKASLISGKDFYPSGVSLWSRMDPKMKKKTAKIYENLCYQIRLSPLVDSISEDLNTSLTKLSVSVKNIQTEEIYTKNGFLSIKQLITK